MVPCDPYVRKIIRLSVVTSDSLLMFIFKWNVNPGRTWLHVTKTAQLAVCYDLWLKEVS